MYKRQDIRNFKAANNCERIAVLWAASTEIYIPLSKEHESLAALEQAMKENNTEVISPSMCYASVSYTHLWYVPPRRRPKPVPDGT